MLSKNRIVFAVTAGIERQSDETIHYEKESLIKLIEKHKKER